MSKPLTLSQKVFNKSYRHLLRQGKKSVSGNICRYRGPNGLRCAAGPFITNKEYDPSFEGRSVTTPRVSSILEKKGFGEAEIEVLSNLQFVHDGYEVHEWKGQLEKVAKEHNLTIPAL